MEAERLNFCKGSGCEKQLIESNTLHPKAGVPGLKIPGPQRKNKVTH